MIFIITILLLAADFYYLKNIAGRRLVGLRWWNEVDPASGESKWVFESSEPGTKTVNPTDSRFFWLALYVQPVLWTLLAVFAVVRLQFLWLPLVSTSPPFPQSPVLLTALLAWMFGCCLARCAVARSECTLTASSYCSRAYDHEHACLLTLRQV